MPEREHNMGFLFNPYGQPEAALPIPIRAARQVGKVLRHVPVGQKEATEHPYYMSGTETGRTLLARPAARLCPGKPRREPGDGRRNCRGQSKSKRCPNRHGGSLWITEEIGVHMLHDVCAYIKEFTFVLDRNKRALRPVVLCNLELASSANGAVLHALNGSCLQALHIGVLRPGSMGWKEQIRFRSKSKKDYTADR
ncbi:MULTISPECIES: hypothetical protein [unclassified Mesorhizobium]|uniref:hypothetical protein n=1 Tax=unclassified Mesorhizobium TaxID=325217 RepID=UPI001651015F|nr:MULTISPECIES: hypothetical protein [unclassified Mesorhizobium]